MKNIILYSLLLVLILEINLSISYLISITDLSNFSIFNIGVVVGAVEPICIALIIEKCYKKKD